MVSERSEPKGSNLINMSRLGVLEQINELNLEDISSGRALTEAKLTKEAIHTLRVISELDPELNDAETYRDAVRLILVNGGWVE